EVSKGGSRSFGRSRGHKAHTNQTSRAAGMRMLLHFLKVLIFHRNARFQNDVESTQFNERKSRCEPQLQSQSLASASLVGALARLHSNRLRTAARARSRRQKTRCNGRRSSNR